MGSQFVRRLLAFGQTRAERQQRDLGAFANNAALADLERDAGFRHLDAAAFAARIAQRARTVVDRDLGRHHVHQLGLVGGRHDDEIGQAAEIGVVERAGMGGTVGADQSGAIDRETYRQALDRDVVHHLVIAALQEGRIDRAERFVALGRKTGGKCHRMLFGDADIEGALWEGFGENIDPGAGRHCGGNADDLVVLLRLLDEALAEYVLVGRRIRLGFRLRAGRDVEFYDGVILVGGSFRRAVALALLRHDMDQDRTSLHVAYVLQDRQQMVEIVAVDRADIIEAEFLEQRAAADHEAAGIFFRPVGAVRQHFRQMLAELLGGFAQRAVGLAGIEPRQIGRHRADRRRNRHVVVVENDDQPGIHRTRIVHGLVSHAGGHRAVADHGNDIILAAGEVARHRHAERRRDRGRGMGGAERIVIAFGSLGETGQPAAGAKRADAVAAAGQDLVRIGLVADVPDQAIARGVEHVVQRRRQFDDAEAGAEMPACNRDGIDGFLAQFVGNLPDLFHLEPAQIGRGADRIEKRRLTECGHGDIPILHVGTQALVSLSPT